MSTNGQVTAPARISRPGGGGGPGRALILAEATRYARAGRYDEARRALGELDDVVGDTQALDLQARMYAQQGWLDEADRCWERAQALDPDLPGARAGRDRIAELRAGRHVPGRRGGRVAALAVGGVLVVAAAAAAGAWLGPRASDGAPDHALAELGRQQQRTADEVAGLRAAVQPGESPELRALAERLAGSRVTARPVPGGTVLTFQDGLFSGGDTLSPDGRAAVADLGRRLAPLAGRWPITVVGHVSGTAGSADERADDVDLGLERADAAARVLAGAAGRPLLDVRLTSAGSDAPPFPGGAGADRARNRTVSVTVGEP